LGDIKQRNIILKLSFSNETEAIEPDIAPLNEPITIEPETKIEKEQLYASSFEAALDSVSSIESTVDLLEPSIPDAAIELTENFIDDTNMESLNMEIKSIQITTKPKDKKYTTNTNTQGQRGGSLAAETRSVPNVSKNTNIGDIQQRLKEYGAKTGDVQISLSWDTVDDLDLYVVVKPMNSQINWTNRIGFCGGALDIDMNAHPRLLNQRPIENIFWREGNAPFGEYIVGVHFFMNWSRAQEVKATVVIKKDGKTESIPVIVRYRQPLTPVKSFTRQR